MAIRIDHSNSDLFLQAAFDYLRENFDGTMSDFVVHEDALTDPDNNTKFIAEVESERVVHIAIDNKEFSVETKIDAFFPGGKRWPGGCKIKFSVTGILYKYNTVEQAAIAAARKYIWLRKSFEDRLVEFGEATTIMLTSRKIDFDNLELALTIDGDTERYQLMIHGTEEVTRKPLEVMYVNGIL